jgi:hypothetical protein
VIDVEYLNEPLRLINLEDDEMAMSLGLFRKMTNRNSGKPSSGSPSG